MLNCSSSRRHSCLTDGRHKYCTNGCHIAHTSSYWSSCVLGCPLNTPRREEPDRQASIRTAGYREELWGVRAVKDHTYPWKSHSWRSNITKPSLNSYLKKPKQTDRSPLQVSGKLVEAFLEYTGKNSHVAKSNIVLATGKRTTFVRGGGMA